MVLWVGARRRRLQKAGDYSSAWRRGTFYTAALEMLSNSQILGLTLHLHSRHHSPQQLLCHLTDKLRV